MEGLRKNVQNIISEINLFMESIQGSMPSYSLKYNYGNLCFEMDHTCLLDNESTYMLHS